MWPTGLSWTKGYETKTTNPDGTAVDIRVHGGPFFFTPGLFGRRLPMPWVMIHPMTKKIMWSTLSVRWRFVYIYAGFRPTPVWSSGYGDEGLLASLARRLKAAGWGNFSLLTVRFKDVMSN